MYYEANKEAIDAMMSAPGEVRGEVLKIDEHFVLEKGGREKLKQIERELDVMGHPFLYGEIKSKKYYPWGRRALSLLAISRVLGMNKKEVEEMGKAAPKKSFLVNLLTRRFLTVERIFTRSSKMWRKDHTVGRLEVVEADKEAKKVVLRLYNLNFHPVFCDYLCGYFTAIAENGGVTKVSCEEVKCYFKGESLFHEFLLKWE